VKKRYIKKFLLLKRDELMKISSEMMIYKDVSFENIFYYNLLIINNLE